MIEAVTTILRNIFGWENDEAPAPGAVEEYARLNPKAGADSIAATLENWLINTSLNLPKPYGWPGTAKTYLRMKAFTDGVEMWETKTAIALGLYVEPEVVQGPEAHNVDEWWANLMECLSYEGFKLLDLETTEGSDEWNKRLAVATKIPALWALSGLSLVYQILVLQGWHKPWVGGFGAPVVNVRDYIGASGQKILDNLWAVKARRPPTWFADKAWAKNPDPEAYVGG